jgi:hypothetical protein
MSKNRSKAPVFLSFSGKQKTLSLKVKILRFAQDVSIASALAAKQVVRSDAFNGDGG